MMTENGKITLNLTSKQLVRLSAALLDSVMDNATRADEVAKLTGPGAVEMLATYKAHRQECIKLMELINHEYDRHSADNPDNEGRRCRINPVQTPS
jgi:hypothetical protein